MMLMPDSLNIFKVMPRDFPRNEWKEKMAFKAFVCLGIVLAIAAYQVGFTIPLKTAVMYGTEGYQFVWTYFNESTVGRLLTSKILTNSIYQPFFTYMNISLIELIVPCALKTIYATKRLKSLFGQRIMFAVYFALIAVYASFARENQAVRDIFLLFINGAFVFRTLDAERERPIETVIIMSITCACVVPLHLALDLALVMCLSEEVVKAYQGDFARLKVFAGCVVIDCMIVQFMRLIEVSKDFTSETLYLIVNFLLAAILIHVATVRGRPRDLRTSYPAFLTLFYIYTRNTRL